LFRSPRAISWAATIVTICPLLTLFRVSPVFITILLSPGGLGFTAPVVSPPQLFILPSDSFQPLPVSGSPDHIYFVVFIVLAFTHLVPSFCNPFIKLYASIGVSGGYSHNGPACVHLNCINELIPY